MEHQISCGIVMKNREGKYLVVRGGGPYFDNKLRAYGFPKGLKNEGESEVDCALREFYEETGQKIEGDIKKVWEGKTKSGKKLVFFLGKGEFNGKLTSNTCEIEYPKGSGKMIEIPEVQDGKMLTLDEIEKVIFQSQLGLVDSLRALENNLKTE